jgi:hypothetical protein
LNDEAVGAIREAMQRPAEGDEGVWPENVGVVEAFLSISSQWRTASIGGGLSPSRLVYLGLDYAGARAGIEAAGIAITPELWAGVRVMEDAACDALNGVEG